MHAILITFTSSADDQELQKTASEFAEVVRNVPGLLSKAWLADGSTQGGFYVFTDRTAADGYINGPLVKSLRAHPAFSDFDIRQFAVDPELSARTWLVARGNPQE
ncbi:YdhR family protein [Amycolatopsis jejuensis]|uniref:YdhR family protein n=1 Tax=Amycolatopsis jejuensis TaxID=330084 RepID=UPI000A5BC081|nr:YdhR family protein [Amycolatopsis jejuensis]